MVTKSRAFRVDTSYDTHDYTQVGNNPIPPPLHTSRWMACNKAMTHPGSYLGWKQRVEQGLDATTGFSGTVTSAVVSPGVINFEVETTDLYGGPVSRTHQERTGNLVGEPSFTYPGSVSTTKAQNDAKMRFVSEVTKAQRGLQSMVDLGEIGESLRMIRRPGEALRRGLDEYLFTAKKRRNRAKPGRRNSVVASTWLEYVFGWRPLISDIKGGFEGLATAAQNDPAYQLVRGYAEDRSHGPFFPFSSDQGLYTRIDEGRVISVAKCVIRGSVCVNQGASPTKRALYQMGISWDQVIPTAWELIPYSFVADYFANIGDILSAYAVNMASIRWYNMCVIRENVSTSRLVACLPKPITAQQRWVQKYATSGLIEASSKLVDRSPGTFSLVPSLEFRLPFCDTQWINLAALFEQARK